MYKLKYLLKIVKIDIAGQNFKLVIFQLLGMFDENITLF